MRKSSLISSSCAFLALAGLALAQRPDGPARPGGPPPGFNPFGVTPPKAADVADLAARMMAFDKDKDGKLARAEVDDERLLGLFDRADIDKDGVVARADIVAVGEKEYLGGPSFPGGGGGGPPIRPGEVLPAMLQYRLGLTTAQRVQVAELQAEVDGRLAKILDEGQAGQFREIKERGFGPPPGGPPAAAPRD